MFVDEADSSNDDSLITSKEQNVDIISCEKIKMKREK